MKGIGKATCIIAATLCVAAVSCRTTGNGDTQTEKMSGSVIKSPATFDSDSAYAYVARQVAMGPRIPGTRANAECAEYIRTELMRHGADTVTEQRATVTAYNGDRLPINNLMGRFNTEAPARILLVAHYDTRPWADSDSEQINHLEPVPGANDGASGVGVILEIARHLSVNKPAIGVDMLLVDAEDYGQSSGFSNHDETWALGTQYWTEHMPYTQDNMPRYAILLDMVGGIDAKFHREYFSNNYARNIVDKVWGIAARSGYSDRFVNLDGGAVVDDHLYLNRAGIPAIDIVESKNEVTKSFSPTWHTVDDNMDNIDRSSLKAAGQTVLNVIYNESI